MRKSFFAHQLPSAFEIADWLDNFSQVAFVERHRLLLSQRTPDTGEWLLSSEDFVDWQTGAGSWLWLNGISKHSKH